MSFSPGPGEEFLLPGGGLALQVDLFEGDGNVEGLVVCLPDRTHAACAEAADLSR
nr:hypothetical protein [Frankia sp. Cj5]